MVQKPPTKNPEGDFSFLYTHFFFGATTAHTVLRSSKVEAGRANREAPRERNVFSVSPFFFFFFFFFVVGKSFLEQREKERERERYSLRSKKMVLKNVYMSLGSETQDSETGPFVFSNAGAASVTSFREGEETADDEREGETNKFEREMRSFAHVDDESDCEFSMSIWWGKT